MMTAMAPFDFVDIPPAFTLIFTLIDLPFIWLAIIAFKFEVRADDEEIFHRESVTRRIPLDHVEQIRIAFEDARLPDWELTVKRTTIEIFSDDQRIKVTWRKSKLAPLLEFLEHRFPEKIEWMNSPPDN